MSVKIKQGELVRLLDKMGGMGPTGIVEKIQYSKGGHNGYFVRILASHELVRVNRKDFRKNTRGIPKKK